MIARNTRQLQQIHYVCVSVIRLSDAHSIWEDVTFLADAEDIDPDTVQLFNTTQLGCAHWKVDTCK